MDNPATRFGPVAEREFDSAKDCHKPALTAWLEALPTLSDDDFFAATASAIHGSALANSFRGNWNHEYCKASAAHDEAERRHRAAGHSDNCNGDSIYSKAFAQVWRAQGHSRSAYPHRPCNCGANATPGRGAT
jgi:hypothetical protein